MKLYCLQADASTVDNVDATLSSLDKGIKCMQQDDHLCDVVLKAEDTLVSAHKLVLAAHSSFFKAMFLVSIGKQWHQF